MNIEVVRRFCFGVLVALFAMQCFTPVYAGEAADSALKVMSFNIRVSSAPDGEYAWPKRKEAVSAKILAERPSLLGLQEVFPDQREYLDSALAGYARVGCAHPDAAVRGECSPLYYDTDRFALVDSGFFWLSETPETASKGWDAAYPRVCVWALLRDRTTGKEIAFFNTHLDHAGRQARQRGVSLILEKMESIVPEGVATVFCGDLNTVSSDYAFIPLKAVLKEARVTSPETDRVASFNDFGRNSLDNPSCVIDHVFYRGCVPLRFSTLLPGDGESLVSDHYPVVFVFDAN